MGVLQLEVEAIFVKKILEDRLFKKLREELGISYGGASVSVTYELKTRYTFFCRYQR